MSRARSWLTELTLAKLHRVAVSIGSPCSGTKAARVAGIQHAISSTEKSTSTSTFKRDSEPERLSLLSIDMGIRNLAFAHITAPGCLANGPASKGLQYYGFPTLRQWRQVAVGGKHVNGDINGGADSSPMVPGTNSDSDSVDSDAPSANAKPGNTTTKESFEPIDYASHAYHLIRYLLQTYKPTHILIERQRFRSGGRAAVPEWTIRVGVFEGMLYAVLRTLVEEGKLRVQVEPMQPTFVNRYWLEKGDEEKSTAIRHSGREVKRAKIDLIGQMLTEKANPPSVLISEDLRPFASDFVSIWQKDRRKDGLGTNGISKLDDLADCLLQGLAWVEWQNRRRRIHVLGRDGLEQELS